MRIKHLLGYCLLFFVALFAPAAESYSMTITQTQRTSPGCTAGGKEAESLFQQALNYEHGIEAMLAALEKRTEIVFIRNGTEHSAAEAAAHLRLKLGNTRKRLQTAEEFIDKVASSSSMSGKPYFIKQTGREPQTANGFLHELLQQANQ